LTACPAGDSTALSSILFAGCRARCMPVKRSSRFSTKGELSRAVSRRFRRGRDRKQTTNGTINFDTATRFQVTRSAARPEEAIGCDEVVFALGARRDAAVWLRISSPAARCASKSVSCAYLECLSELALRTMSGFTMRSEGAVEMQHAEICGGLPTAGHRGHPYGALTRTRTQHIALLPCVTVTCRTRRPL